MKTHVQKVAKGQAIMGRIPNNKLSTSQGIPDVSFSDHFPPNKEKRNRVDWIEKVRMIIKEAAEFEKDCKVVFGNTGPNLPSPQHVAGAMTAPNSAAVDVALAHNASARSGLTIWGFRYFLCQKCRQSEIVPFYFTADAKNMGGLSLHSCQIISSQHRLIDVIQLDSKNIAEFISEVQKWTGRVPYLSAVKAELATPPQCLNHVNFGELDENHYIPRTVRNCIMMINTQELTDFMAKTLATYCLGEFTRNGSRESYFLYLHK